MAVAELPPQFHDLELKEQERSAALLFVKKAASMGIERAIVAPRRTDTKHLKLVLDFPEDVDRLDWVTKLSRISREVRRETGVHFILD